jgi:hypothetical protein
VLLPSQLPVAPKWCAAMRDGASNTAWLTLTPLPAR